MLLSSFEYGVIPLMKLVMKILRKIDPDLHLIISNAVNDTPEFTLSWILTWLAHDIKELSLIARIFDYFISSHPLAPIYVSIAVFKN